MSISIQERIQIPFDKYALEQLRARFLYCLTDTKNFNDAAAVAIQMAFETEIGTILKKLIYVPDVTIPSTVFNTVASRRSFIDIDADMAKQKYLVNPALDAALTVTQIPPPYVDFIRRYTDKPYPRYRVSAIAALICLVKAVQ